MSDTIDTRLQRLMDKRDKQNNSNRRPFEPATMIHYQAYLMQDKLCKICRNSLKQKKTLWDTKKKALLCDTCFNGLKAFNRNPDLLDEASDYLKK